MVNCNDYASGPAAGSRAQRAACEAVLIVRIEPEPGPGSLTGTGSDSSISEAKNPAPGRVDPLGKPHNPHSPTGVQLGKLCANPGWASSSFDDADDLLHRDAAVSASSPWREVETIHRGGRTRPV